MKKLMKGRKKEDLEEWNRAIEKSCRESGVTST
jgi:hypothetical protein